jgi:hypothetical protein
MAKFRKKPVVIDAVQWWGNNFEEISAFFGEKEHTLRLVCAVDKILEIETLEGVMTARFKDWIIKGVAGEFYPCKPDIFKETYEPIEQ